MTVYTITSVRRGSSHPQYHSHLVGVAGEDQDGAPLRFGIFAVIAKRLD